MKTPEEIAATAARKIIEYCEAVDWGNGKAMLTEYEIKDIIKNEIVADKQVEQLRASVNELDSYLSLLRYRAAIQWGAAGLPSQMEIDHAIGRARRLTDRVRPSQAALLVGEEEK